MDGKKNHEISIRSSAAEYLTYIAAIGDGEHALEIRYEDENIRLTQKMMAALYNVSIPAINQHVKKIFDDNELDEHSVVKKYLITADDGKNIIPTTITCRRSSPSDSRSTTSGRFSSGSGRISSSRITRFRAGSWMTRDSRISAPSSQKTTLKNNWKKSVKSSSPKDDSIRRSPTSMPPPSIMTRVQGPQRDSF